MSAKSPYQWYEHYMNERQKHPEFKEFSPKEFIHFAMMSDILNNQTSIFEQLNAISKGQQKVDTEIQDLPKRWQEIANYKSPS